jgi:hypothetical protein
MVEMPVVYARATPGCKLAPIIGRFNHGPRPPITMVTVDSSKANDELLNMPSAAIIQNTEIEASRDIRFRITVTIEFVNCSPLPARINITEYPNATLIGVVLGEELVLPPHETRHIVWTRDLNSGELR